MRIILSLLLPFGLFFLGSGTKATAEPEEKLTVIEVLEIANQPHQPIVDIPQLITAKLRVGIWERETTIDVHESSFQEPKKIIRKSTARIKHAHGKYVVFHAYDEEGNKVHTEVHSYSSKAKKLLSVGISNNGTVSRMVGIPNLKKRTIDWEMEFSQSNKTAQMSITCDKDGMSIQIKGRQKLEEKVKASWTAIAKWTDDLTAEALADNKTTEISIWEAASKGNLEAVKKNLAMGIDIGAKDEIWDGTPLHHAAYSGKNEVALFLINKGANINAIGGPKGFPAMETPLDVATRQAQINIIDLLRKHGAKTIKELKAKVNAPTDSLADSIVGKVITVVVSERIRPQMRFNANGVMLVAGQDGNLEDRGLTYKIKGNEVLVFEDGERDGGLLFSSSSPKVGDQVEMGSEDDKQKFIIIKIEALEVEVNSSEEEEKQQKVNEAVTEVADLPPLPETVTKEFIMDLWAKPHDGRDMIKEFADGQIREGIWKVISNRGPRKGEIIDTIESTMTLKMVNRRYQIWEWREGEFLSYTVTTYDYDASRYRWWGTSSEWTSIFEHHGQRYLRNLIEWKAVNLPDPELQSTMRTTFISEDGKRFKVIGKATRNGEVVSYSTSEFSWHSELPEEHRLRETKKQPLTPDP